MKNKSILYSLTKSLLDTVSMHLFLDIPPTHSRSFSLIVSLPLSFSFDTSPTLSSYVPLSNNYYLSLSTISLYLSISPFYSPYRCYFVIVSPYLPLSLIFSLFDATSDCSWLNVCDSIPLILSFLLWYDYHNHCFCFCFNNYYFLACFVAC